MSSPARVARRRPFVSSGASFRAGIRAQGVCAASYTLVEELLTGKEPVHHVVQRQVQSFRRSTSA
jgi:hypothetical protein